MSAQAQKKQDLNSPAFDQGYDFTDADFNYFRDLIGSLTGISLSDSKRDLVYGRLSKRLRATGLTSFDKYRALLADAGNQEIEQFTNALTTNLTAFFREKHHFEYLGEQLQARILEITRQRQRLRIWSAGCSTGEEPYSLAITLAEVIPNFESYDIRILATDLDSNVLKHAQNGIYAASRIEGLSEARTKRWFKKGSGEHKDKVRVSGKLKQLISFRQLNLMQSWPMSGLFDFVFCRNVVIYFEKPTQKKLFDRFANILKPDSHLFIGHSENLHNLSERFELIGKTVYRRIR